MINFIVKALEVHMTLASRRFYGKVVYDEQKQTYIFIENNTLVSSEKSTLVIFHEPTKHCFRYEQ